MVPRAQVVPLVCRLVGGLTVDCPTGLDRAVHRLREHEPVESVSDVTYGAFDVQLPATARTHAGQGVRQGRLPSVDSGDGRV
jgi:hypothetical protein